MIRDNIYVGALFSDQYLEHHGILGMKWGVRRYQNPDGSLTEAGKKRYGDKDTMIAEKYRSKIDKYAYRVPRLSKSDDVISILKYDQKRPEGLRNFRYFPDTTLATLNPLISTVYPIHHYADKNGKIALSYSHVPMHGDIYVRGPGNINDVDMNKHFRRPPKLSQIKG